MRCSSGKKRLRLGRKRRSNQNHFLLPSSF
jgi:hypothetical protein